MEEDEFPRIPFCGHCKHPEHLHVKGDDGFCRATGCKCHQWVLGGYIYPSTPESRAALERDAANRSIAYETAKKRREDRESEREAERGLWLKGIRKERQVAKSTVWRRKQRDSGALPVHSLVDGIEVPEDDAAQENIESVPMEEEFLIRLGLWSERKRR